MLIDKWLAADVQIFAAILFGTIVLIAVIEEVWPRRALNSPRGLRWSGNLLIYLIDVVTVRLIIPILTVGMGVLVAERGWGLFNLVTVPIPVAVIATFLLIDFSRYLQHVLLHRLTLLWRLHKIHHTDQDYDFSTGLRFHPLESLFTVGYDVVVILFLGPPIVTVLIYEALKLIWATFAHANINVPLSLDRQMRRVLVTPDLHRVHHSTAVGETNSNFGAISPIWDRLFGTYIDQPAHGHQAMTIGLVDHRGTEHLKLSNMLLGPFRKN